MIEESEDDLIVSCEWLRTILYGRNPGPSARVVVTEGFIFRNPPA